LKFVLSSLAFPFAFLEILPTFSQNNSMKLNSIFLFLFLSIATCFAQKNDSPVKMEQSDDFDSPGRHEILSPIPYGEKGILQVNSKGIKSFKFSMVF